MPQFPHQCLCPSISRHQDGDGSTRRGENPPPEAAVDLGCIHQMCPNSLGPCRVPAAAEPSPTPTEARALPSASPELPAVVPLLPAKKGHRCHCQGPRSQQVTVQELLWGHLLWGGNFLLLVLCLKMQCLSSSEQLGLGAPSKGLQGHLSELWAAGAVPPTAIRHLCCSTDTAVGHLKPQQPPMHPMVLEVSSNLNDTFIL